ncbi:hypothetical protein V8C86DRAFT_3034039 [Haematococcus lacustris]
MAAHGDAAPPTHLVDDAPSEAASWTQRVKKKTHNVVALLNKLKTSKAVREDYRAMVDMRLKKVIIACVLQHDDRAVPAYRPLLQTGRCCRPNSHHLSEATLPRATTSHRQVLCIVCGYLWCTVRGVQGYTCLHLSRLPLDFLPVLRSFTHLLHTPHSSSPSLRHLCTSLSVLVAAESDVAFDMGS